MTRIFFISFALVVAFTSNSFAKHECDSSSYASVMPDHKGISFGLSVSAAKTAVNALYKGTGSIKSDDAGITISLRSAHQKVFDQIYVGLTNGVVTRLAWSYSNGFQRKMGGPSDALMAILTKLKDKIGPARDTDKVDKGIKVMWEAKQGLSLTVIGKDPFSLFMNFECESLAESEKSKIRDATNMGF